MGGFRDLVFGSEEAKLELVFTILCGGNKESELTQAICRPILYELAIAGGWEIRHRAPSDK